MAGIRGLYQPFKIKSNTEAFGSLYAEADFRFGATPAATIASYGKGKIAGVYFNVGRYYLRMNNTVYRNFINGLVHRLFPNPKVEVKGSGDVLVTVNQIKNKLAVNLVNISGPHANTRVARYDNIPSVGPLEIKIKLDAEPKSATLQPENIKMKYSYKNGELKTMIEKVDVHSIIVIE